MDTHVRRGHRRSGRPETTLDPDEQDELALKLRYSVGLEQLLSVPDAAAVRALGIVSARPNAPSPPPPQPDEGTRARAAALGLGAGARGRWLSRCRAER